MKVRRSRLQVTVMAREVFPERENFGGRPKMARSGKGLLVVSVWFDVFQEFFRVDGLAQVVHGTHFFGLDGVSV